MNEETRKELEKLRSQRLVSDARARLHPTPMSRAEVVRIGVTYRTDSAGKAHVDHDLKAITAINELRDRLGKKLFSFTVEPVTLPRGASGPDSPVREAKWSDLDDIDLLYIPGAPQANDTQEATSTTLPEATEEQGFNRLVAPVMPTSQKKMGEYQAQLKKYNRLLKEHSERARYELRLLAIARDRGIPVLAICAGSWRLLESYGGKVRTLEVTSRNKHKAANPTDTWTLSHALKLLGGKTLVKLMEKKGVLVSGVTIDVSDVNSTHWAVASTTPDGSTLASGASDPSKFLEITAQDPDTNTVEAFEALFGTPVMGIQWHPESYLPGMLGETSGSAEARLISKTIFEFMTFAALVSKRRRGDLVPTLNCEARAFDLLCGSVKALAQEKMVSAGNLYIGATSALPRALWSARMEVIDQAIDVLGEYFKEMEAKRMVSAGNLYRDAASKLREYGVTI